MRKVAICLIARLKSSRLPEKVIKEVQGKYIIQHLIDNLKKISSENIEVVMCTTKEPEDDVLQEIAASNSIKCVRGSVLSVSDRMLEAADLTNADIVVRVTGDNIFTDESLVKTLIDGHIEHDVEYSRIEGLPMGVTAEVMNTETLRVCYEENDKTTSEYMTLHLYLPEKYKVLVIDVDPSNADINLSVDTPEDYERTLQIFKYLGEDRSIKDIVQIINEHSIPYSYVDKTKSVKLIDEVKEYEEYRAYLNALKAKAKNVIITL